MPESKSIKIFGYSGHSYVVVESAFSMGHEIKGYFDFEEAACNPYDLTYLGPEQTYSYEQELLTDYFFPSVGSNKIRENLVNFIELKGLSETIILDARSLIASTAKIGLSTFIGPAAVLNSMAIIGKGCIVNSGAIIEHECRLADFSHVAPGTVLAGNVEIGAKTLIGANSVIKEGKKIGKNVVVGAGSVVVSDIPDNEIWVGNPAKRMNVY